MSRHHSAKFYTELENGAAEVILRQVQMSDGTVSVQSVNDVPSALVVKLAVLEVQLFKMFLMQ